MLTLAFGSNFDAPVTEMLEDGITVLDAGCGTFILVNGIYD